MKFVGLRGVENNTKADGKGEIGAIFSLIALLAVSRMSMIDVF